MEIKFAGEPIQWEDIEDFSVFILDDEYSLLISLFDEFQVEENEIPIEEIGLSDLEIIPHLMQYINRSICDYPAIMWNKIIDVYLLLNWLGYMYMTPWINEAREKSSELNTYLLEKGNM